MIHRDRRPRARRVPVAAAALALVAACAGAELPETAPVMADAPAHSIVAGDGALLPYREWLPAASPKAVVLGLHGFNDYSKAYDTLGRFLAERGIATYAYDQRGFGAAPRRSYWPGVDALLGDA